MARRSKRQQAPPRAAQPTPPRPRSALWWHLALLLAVTFAIYGNSLTNGFVSDDDFQVLGNKLITDYHNLPKIFTSNVWAFANSGMTNYFRPLHMVVYMAEFYLFGLDPFSWHFANLVFHALALVAAYFLVRALAGETLAFWAGLWFALHPIHVEAVIWVAVVTDLLCGLALFAGVFYYHRARTDARPYRFYALSVLAFFCGLLVKETAFVFPGLLLAYEFFYRRESPLAILRALVRYIPFAAVAAAYLALRLNALGRFAPASGMHFKLSLWEMFLSVPVLFAKYVWKLFVPLDLNYYYVYHPVRTLGWPVFTSLLLIAGLAAAMFWLRQWQPLLAFSLAWFFITLAPVLSIPNVGENVFTERYLYIPSLGFCVLGAWAWLEIRRRVPATRQAVAGALALLFVFYAVQTVRRNPDWKDDMTLFTKTAEQSPESATTLSNLGYIHYLHGHVDRAIQFYRRSLELEPRRALTHNNLGNALSNKGQFDQAIVHLRKATELKTDYFGAWLNLGLVYAAQKGWDPAIESYQKALAIKSDFAEALTAMGLALWAKGQPADSIASYRKALAAKPDYIEAHINLASALSETGAPDEAVEHLQTVLRLRPGGPHASVVHFNLGINYERKQLWKAALVEYERALLLNPAFPEARKKVEYLRSRLPAESQPQPFSPLQRRF